NRHDRRSPRAARRAAEAADIVATATASFRLIRPSKAPPYVTLSAWLAYLETLHPKAIAMGLDRVRAAYERLGVELACPIVTVSGTNGKGSTCALLDRMLRSGGYRVGTYTSPHLLRYNERVRLDGVDA